MNLDGLPLTHRQIVTIAESEHRPISIWSGAVRSGKTIAACWAFLIAVAKAPAVGEIIIVGKTLQTIERNILGPMQSQQLFPVFHKQVHHVRGSSTAKVLGRTVHLVGANDARSEEKVRGMTVCLSMVDEATLVPEAFWNMLHSRHSVRGARMLATTNPDSRSHWMRKEWLLKPDEKDLSYFHFELTDNTFLPPEYIERTVNAYSGLWYKRFILGEWVQAEGAIYDMWDEEKHVVDVLPRITRWIAAGVDYGTASVFSAELLGLGEDNRLYLASEFRYDAKKAAKQLTDSEYYQRVTGWLDANNARPDFIVVDPSASSFITQMNWEGRAATKGDNSVLDGIRVVSTLMATDKLRVHRSCKGFIDEAPGYAWDDDKVKLGEDKPIKADDHSLDAARYAIKTTEYQWSSYLRATA